MIDECMRNEKQFMMYEDDADLAEQETRAGTLQIMATESDVS